jgi:hypothetical protein
LLTRHGESIKIVKRRLGHATAAETLDTYESSWHQLREPASSVIAFSAARSLAVAPRIARPTKGAVSDPNPPGDPVLSKVIKVPPSMASRIRVDSIGNGPCTVRITVRSPGTSSTIS